MAEPRPGRRVVRTRSDKATARAAAGLPGVLLHKTPASESNFVGVALKSQQGPQGIPNSLTDQTAQQQIAVGETYVIDISGDWVLPAALLPAAAAEGDAIYLRRADEKLVNAAEALTDPDTAGAAGPVLEVAYAKFGVLEELDVDGTGTFCLINLAARDVL